MIKHKLGEASRIKVLPAHPSAVRGFSADMIVSVVAHISDEDAAWEAMQPTVKSLPKPPEEGGCHD